MKQFYKIPTQLLNNKNLSQIEKTIYVILISHFNSKTKQCNPSQQYISKTRKLRCPCYVEYGADSLYHTRLH